MGEDRPSPEGSIRAGLNNPSAETTNRWNFDRGRWVFLEETQDANWAIPRNGASGV
jgi:hypothetical protein